MKNIYILLLIAVVPSYFSAATYTNKTGHPVIISTHVDCDDVMNDEPQVEHLSFYKNMRQSVMIHEECFNGQCLEEILEEPCTKVVTIGLGKDESGELANQAGQFVTIVSPKLNEERKFFPTNDSFNYEITVGSGSASYSKLTINRAE